jgi:uncharacterized protein YndB with AHSA1/START domain
MVITHRFCVPAKRVFDAWIDPAVTSRWLFATPDGQIVRCEIDARPGGVFTITDRRAGEDVAHVGRYGEIDSPRRLVFSFGVPKFSSAMTRVEISIAEAASGCDLTLAHFDVPEEWQKQTEQGWKELLGKLDEMLGAWPTA